jgi:hypothetical protein
VWGGSRTWAGARAQAVLMSVWRTCWQQGLSALDFLSQLLRGPPPQDRAIAGLNVQPAVAAVTRKPRDRERCTPANAPCYTARCRSAERHVRRHELIARVIDHERGNARVSEVFSLQG